MPKKLLENAAAEKEANDVGMRYMNSSDVLKDMRRDYGSAVDGIRLHDDSIANAKVTAAGKDGIASGKDIYMRAGYLSSHAPEVNGLVAHEVTHVMQQGNDMSQSVEYGSEQGGVADWFKKHFTKRGRMQISEPTLQAHHSVASADELTSLGNITNGDDLEFAMAMASAKKGVTDRDRKKNDDGTYAAGYKEGTKEYHTADSLALARALKSKGLSRAAQGSALAQSLAQRDFTSYYQPLIAQELAQGANPAFLFRGNGSGALTNFNTVMKAIEPEGMARSVLGGISEEDEREAVVTDVRNQAYNQALDHQRLGKSLNEEQQAALQRGLLPVSGNVDDLLNQVGDIVAGKDDQGSTVGDYITGVRSAFQGVDDDTFSGIMMNNLLLRGNFGADAGTLDAIELPEEVTKGYEVVGKAKLAQALQRQANVITSDAARTKSSRFGNALSRILRRKSS